VRINVAGRINMFPEDMQKEMLELMEKTKDYSDYKLNLAMAYGGKAEIIDAVNRSINNGSEINEEALMNNLYIRDDVDLLIRPGGEHRLSNFLLWQSSYAEVYFSDKLWPEFEKEDLVKAVEWYGDRERRFGE
jgi:undecaprenyl diphosphate synthase